MSARCSTAGLSAILWLVLHSAAAGQDTDASRFDLDRDGFLEAGEEMHVLALHISSPILRQYDNAPLDGRLSDNEIAMIYADAEKKAVSPAVLGVLALIDDKLLENDRAPVGEIKIPDLTSIDEALDTATAQLDPECELKDRFFIRRDKIDMSIYNKKLGVKEKAGASFVLDRDFVDNVTSATIDAAAAFVLFRNTCRDFGPGDDLDDAFASGFSLATYADLAGNIGFDEPSRGNAQFGLDGQLELQGGLFRYQYLTAGVYVLSDFDGNGFAYGGEFTWEPVDERLHMGTTRRGNPWLEWYWSPIFRVDGLRTVDAGSFNLDPESNYVWLGADIEFTANLVPSMFDQRLYAKAFANLYWEAVTHEFTDQYGAGLFYNIDPAGFTSVSTEYVYGTDRKDRVHKEALTMRLNFKY